MLFVAGPGHGGPAVVANVYLEGTYSEIYPQVSADEQGLLLWVQRHSGLGAGEMERALDRESGLLGLCGRADMREAIAGADAGDERCRLAFDVYVHRLVAGVGAMAAALGGVDALVFTGGVGESSPRVRDAAVAKLAFLDPDVLVVEAREDVEIAAQVRAALAGRGGAL